MIRRTMIALSLAAALVATPLLAADDWQMPRTPWGHPDLQGLWTNTTLTPFERPVEMGDKAFLTEEEVAQAEAARQAMIQNRAEQPAQKAEAGQNVGAYNLHWLELGTKIVGSRRTSLVVDPPSGRVPVRPEAQQVRADNLVKMFDSYEHMSVWDRCVTRGVPGHLFPAGYNNNYRIAQTPEYVVIYSEMINDVRFIPVDGRERIPENLHLWNGDSRGHWDGDTLVVETKNFSDKGWIATSGSQGRIKGIPGQHGTRHRGALHAHRRAHGGLDGHDRGSGQLHGRLDRQHPALLRSRQRDVRVRLPRGQLGGLQHVERRPPPGEDGRGQQPVDASVRESAASPRPARNQATRPRFRAARGTTR